MSGTFAPAPGRAPLLRQLRAQIGMETRLLLRNPEQVLLALVIPLVVLVGGVLAGRHLGLHLTQSPADTLTPGVMALAVMSTSFTSLAIATGFERRHGVLKWLGTAPLPRGGLLSGKVGALLVVQVLQLAAVALVGLLLGWRPAVAVTAWVGTLACWLLGTAAFASCGLLMAGSLRAEATLGAANLVYLLLLAGGAVVLPASAYGDAGAALAFLPSGALGEGMRSALLQGDLPVVAMLVLLGWAVLGSVLTARTFSWE